MQTNKPEVRRFNILTYQGAIQSKGAMCVLASDYDAMQAECERLRKDAERYRFIRDTEELPMNLMRLDMMGDRLDSAIDAAMQEQQP